MKVEVYYVGGCPHHRPAVERVQALLRDEGIVTAVSEIEIPDQKAARDHGFPGSPTVRVNGLDIDPASRGVTDGAFACRCYPGGIPSEEMIRAALREARGQGR